MLIAIFVHLSKREPTPLSKASHFIRDPQKREPTSTRRKSSHLVQDIVSVTHVCRSWRRVAIATPELWTEIRMTKLEVVEVFLERSGAVPLIVDLPLHSGGQIDSDLLRTVVPHTYRFCQLSVLSHRGPLYIGSACFPKPAPLLVRLTIHHPMGNSPILLFGDQAPRIRELVIFSNGVWLQNKLWRLTSLHVTLYKTGRTRSRLLPFFDMLDRCPVLEEMFLSWGNWAVHPEPPQLPTVPLHRLRRLLLHSFYVENVKYLLRAFDLKTDGVAIHLNGVHPRHEGITTISDIQAMFSNDKPGQPSLVSSTKLELIFHARPRTAIMHAIGPGFSIRVDLCLDEFISLSDVAEYIFYDTLPSVKDLLVRGSSRVDTKIGGIENLTALQKLVLIGRGSKMVRDFQQALSPGPSGVLPCPLLSTIDFQGDTSEMCEMFHLLRTRSSAGHQLGRVRVPSCFIPLPADVASCVKDVGSLDIPLRKLHRYAMELPKFCFVGREHEWWRPWKSRLN